MQLFARLDALNVQKILMIYLQRLKLIARSRSFLPIFPSSN